jgi:hypothetical protein
MRGQVSDKSCACHNLVEVSFALEGKIPYAKHANLGSLNADEKAVRKYLSWQFCPL